MALDFNKRNKGESKREYAARKLGGKPSDYDDSGKKKSTSSSSSSSKSSSSQKNEEKTIKKYYGQKESDIKETAATKSTRLVEDLANVMRDAGIQQTRATEDYIRNIQNITDNKAADIADVNDYVATNKGRTQEDLDTSLAKEARRYSIEYDKTNQSLADAGMTFSDRKQEKVDAAGNVQAVADVNTVATRSFQDIARYEAVKNRDIELNYGQKTATAETTKTRTLEDILNEQADAKLKEQRGQSDISTGKAIDIRANDYAETGSLTDTGNFYDKVANDKQNQLDMLTFKGNA